MATTTTHYGFTKPGVNDYVDVSVLNANYDNLDNVIYNNQVSAQAALDDLAPEYDATATYSVGDYVTYNKTLYRCTTAIATAEAFDDTKWTAVKVGGELKSHDARISDLEAGVDLEKSATNSFDDGIDSYFKKVVSTIVPVQAGSGTPSPTNVRAISGFTECEVTNNGKNLANLQPRAEIINAGVKSTIYSDNRIVASGTSTGLGDIEINLQVPINMKANTTYTFSVSGECDAQYLYILDSVSGTNKHEVFRTGVASFSWTSDAVINTIIIRSFNGVTVSVDGRMQVEKGSTATDYTPYVAPNTATISFGSAGTVYGGRVGLISGKLLVDRVKVKGGWTEYKRNNGFVAYRQTMPYFGKYSSYAGMSNITDVMNSFNSDNMSYNAIQPPTNATRNSYMALQDDFDPDDVELVYEIQTPQEYQLTPAQLRSLVGANRLTSSTGEVTEVEYIKNKTIAWLLDLIRA